MPGEIVEVILEAAAGEDGGQAFKHEIEALIELVGIGKRAGIGLVLMGVIAMDLQLFDDAGGWREAGRRRRNGFERVMRVSGDEVVRGRATRPFLASSCRKRERGLHRQERPEHSGGRRTGTVLLRDAKRADARGGKE